MKGKEAHLIRERETHEDLFAKERAVPASVLSLTTGPQEREEEEAEAEAAA